MFRGSIAPDPLHCIPALILKTLSVFGSRVSPTFPGKWMQGRERGRDEGGGGGHFVLYMTYFAGYFLNNSNFEGGTFFVELFYKLNTTPRFLVIVNGQSLNEIQTIFSKLAKQSSNEAIVSGFVKCA